MGFGGRLLVAMVVMLAMGSPHATAHPGPSTALHALDDRIATAPDDVALRLRRSEHLRRMGHPRTALADVRVATRLRPGDRTVWLERALVLAALGRNRAAERELDRVLAAGPALVVPLTERARLRAADGRLDAARADLSLAIGLHATPELVLTRGALDERRERLDDAAAGYIEGLDALGPAVVVQLALVDVQRRRGATVQALSALDTLSAQAPAQADWILLRADILDDLGQPASATVERLRALVVADGAARRRPTPLHRLALVRVHLALGETTVARETLSLVLRDAPTLPAALALSARLPAAPELP